MIFFTDMQFENTNVHDDGLDASEVDSAGTSTPFSSSSFESSPLWCNDIRISHPPTNSLAR